MRAALTLSLAGPCALVLYAVFAYRYTAYCRIGPRNPFAARAPVPGHIPQWLIKTGPLPANSSSVRVLLELARARNHGRVQIRYFTDEQSRAHVGRRGVDDCGVGGSRTGARAPLSGLDTDAGGARRGMASRVGIGGALTEQRHS